MLSQKNFQVNQVALPIRFPYNILRFLDTLFENCGCSMVMLNKINTVNLMALKAIYDTDNRP